VKKERQAGDTTAQEKFRSDSGLAPLDLAQALWVHGAPRMPDANLLDYENEQLAFMWHFVIKWKCNGDVTPSTYVWKGEGKERSRQEWDTRFSALQTRQLVLGRYNPLYSLGLRVPEKNPAPGSRARARARTAQRFLSAAHAARHQPLRRGLGSLEGGRGSIVQAPERQVAVGARRRDLAATAPRDSARAGAAGSRLPPQVRVNWRARASAAPAEADQAEQRCGRRGSGGAGHGSMPPN
jgi:hypothetical protein